MSTLQQKRDYIRYNLAGEEKKMRMRLLNAEYDVVPHSANFLLLQSIRDHPDQFEDEELTEDLLAKIQTEEESMDMMDDLTNLSTNTEVILYYGEQWRPMVNKPKYAVSNYGRICGSKVLAVRIFANDPRYAVSIDHQYLWIESLVHQHFLADDQEMPPYETPTYIIHQNGIITDNRSSNLIAASYDEYYHFLERDSGPNATRERVLRTDIPELFYNPYYHDKTLPGLQFPYIINTDGEIKRKAGEGNVKVKERNSNAEGTFLELWDTKRKASIRVNIAVALIQTFITMDPEQGIPIYIDGNPTHAYLSNLRNGSYDDYIEDTINRLPKQDGEIFRLVGQQRHGTHDRYLLSNQGRLYSLHSRNFMRINQQYLYPNVKLNGKAYSATRLMWTVFIGDIPQDYVVSRIDDDGGMVLSNLELRRAGYGAVGRSRRRFPPLEEATEGDFADERWVRLERCGKVNFGGNLEVSDCGRVRRRGELVRFDTSKEYLEVSYGGTRFLVHILVALVFVPNDDPEVTKVVNHVNLNKHCNFANNLEWVSLQENTAHALGTRIDMVDGDNLLHFLSLRDAARYIQLYESWSIDVLERLIKEAIEENSSVFGRYVVAYGEPRDAVRG